MARAFQPRELSPEEVAAAVAMLDELCALVADKDADVLERSRAFATLASLPPQYRDRMPPALRLLLPTQEGAGAPLGRVRMQAICEMLPPTPPPFPVDPSKISAAIEQIRQAPPARFKLMVGVPPVGKG